MIQRDCYKLNLSQIHPSAGKAFSPNLYEWMKKNAHFYKDGAGTPHGVWRVKAGMARDAFHEGALMLGMAGDQGDFLGSRLMNVLCEGRKAATWCYPGLLARLEPLADFWSTYLRVGRCAIDPDHSIHYLDERWAHRSETQRVCVWCGLVQNRHVFSQLVEREDWV
jgi:hypothetical protein